MRERLAAHISAKRLFSRHHRLLLAVSGGADSVVMARLLNDLGYDIAIAHINYGLRGADSERDEALCRKLSVELGCPFYSASIRLSAKRSDQSLQEEARKKRYAWFGAVAGSEGFDFILTAHHADDQAETVLLNLLRGTGLRGMRGIAEKEGNVVRPMLCFSKEEIEAYARKNKLRFRTDKSNKTTKYRRNFLRIKVMPLLKKLNPALALTMADNAARFVGEYVYLEEALQTSFKKIAATEGDTVKIPAAKLLKEPSPPTLLHYALSPYGFNAQQTGDIVRAAAQADRTGKFFHSPTHRLVIDRDYLVVEPNEHFTTDKIVCCNADDLSALGFLQAKKVKGPARVDANKLIIDAGAITWPVTIRAPRQGDRIHPYGMKGSKLVSDILREKKVNLFDKERIKILVDGTGEIIWVMGIRSSENFRVTGPGKQLLKLTFSEQA